MPACPRTERLHGSRREVSLSMRTKLTSQERVKGACTISAKIEPSQDDIHGPLTAGAAYNEHD